MLKKLLHNVSKQRNEERKAELYRNLIRHEAKIGGEIFGPLVPGRRREFFCLDRHTWIWHEEWTDAQGRQQVQTTRYDVRPNDIIKSQNGQYQSITDREALILRDAVTEYYDRVRTDVYSFVG